MADRTFSRRQVLAGGLGLTGAAAIGIAALEWPTSSGSESVRRALEVAPSAAGKVEHVVFLMQENRSFDHYFGTMKGVSGFGDTHNASAFTQAWPGAPSGIKPSGVLLPFHMDTSKKAECTYDLSHSWPAEHATWNDGAMDAFVSTHTSSGYEGALGTNTMGYFKKDDIPFYYELAEKFTVCDNYFCSVLGPTHPNRLMAISANLDPGGVAGGPIIVTNDLLPPYQGSCSWQTMPDVLSAAGISWKCYNPYGSLYQPGSPDFVSKNMLLYFDQFANADPSSAAYKNAFSYYGPNVTGGLTTTNPNVDDFSADVANGTLPQVSWIMSPDSYDEHPPAPPQLGEWYTQQILDTLTSNPEVWKSTVLFIMYDENDGFFDHVPPPTAPSGTKGEFLTNQSSQTLSQSGGIAGPIGLGVRVPMIVVSPFSAGGWVCSDIFDHTSQLQFLASLFNLHVPNVSDWRASTVGNLMSTLPALATPNYKVPNIAPVSDNAAAPPISNECTPTQILELNSNNGAAPVPTKQKMPKQTPGQLKPTPALPV
jgi:phospholipase C